MRESITRARCLVRGDRDTIQIKGSQDEFRALGFMVKNSPLDTHRMIVTHDNGAREEINTRNEIPKGAESHNIDLRGSGQHSLDRSNSGTRAWAC